VLVLVLVLVLRRLALAAVEAVASPAHSSLHRRSSVAGGSLSGLDTNRAAARRWWRLRHVVFFSSPGCVTPGCIPWNSGLTRCNRVSTETAAQVGFAAVAALSIAAARAS